MFALSFVFFAACLFLQTVYYADFPKDKSFGNGWSALLAGWLGFLKGIPAWLANPLLIAAWVAYAKRKIQHSLVLSTAAAGFMLTFTLVAEMEIGSSGSAKTITSYGSGFYLWVFSAVAQVFASSFPPKARQVSPN